MAGIKVFMCEETTLVQRYRRVYESRDCLPGRSYCNAMVLLDQVEKPPGTYICMSDGTHEGTDWPTTCESCGKDFSDKATRQIFQDRLYRRADTGEEFAWRDAAIGAVRNAWWSPRRGDDGRAIEVVVPDGSSWLVDGRASNCTLPNDKIHRCWVRHGKPEDGSLHVDKSGNTCAAGAGSLDTGKWHGFLHHGELTNC